MTVSSFYRNVSSYISLRITTTIDRVDATTLQMGNSLTSSIYSFCFGGRIVSIVCIRIDNTHISTRFLRICTVTTTIQGVDNICPFHCDICSRHSSGITTAIDILYACSITALNNHLCFGFILLIIRTISLGWVIVCLITTAIHGCYIVSSTIVKRSCTIVL